jgi:hypothetical protein
MVEMRRTRSVLVFLRLFQSTLEHRCAQFPKVTAEYREFNVLSFKQLRDSHDGALAPADLKKIEEATTVLTGGCNEKK